MSTTCLDCGHAIANWRNREADPELRRTHREHAGRSLCRSCYQKRRKLGTLIDIERKTYTREEMLTEWAHLRDNGCSVAQAAERMGMNGEALYRALQRARTLGDPRARFEWTGSWRDLRRGKWAVESPKPLVDSRFHAPETSARTSKIGAEVNGPEPVREHQPGPSPTVLSRLTEGVPHMVLNSTGGAE